MSVEFGGMGSMVVTMKAAAVTTGGIAGMDGNDTVRNANGGVAPVGVVLNIGFFLYLNKKLQNKPEQ